MIYVLQGKSGTTTAFERSTLQEKYLGDLGLDKVDKPVKKVEFVVEDLETPETQLVVVNDVQMGKDTTCRRVSFGVCTKEKLRKFGTSKESKGSLDWSSMRAR
ncbi:hypothetical protein CDL15_Pgr022147 [Punica granatum]|uniref:Uncharacterized protein n=1 Tax=Punica granatum TaxID=22663 RepID=A0A218VU15_PUNGR|nr:hypothetical protein CDL15_Pgr022147 [Punica granatum]